VPARRAQLITILRRLLNKRDRTHRAAGRALEFRCQQDEAEAGDLVARQLLEREVLDQVNPGLGEHVLVHRQRHAAVGIWQHFNRHIVGTDRHHIALRQPAGGGYVDPGLPFQIARVVGGERSRSESGAGLRAAWSWLKQTT
jgi:hypothetical protein